MDTTVVVDRETAEAEIARALEAVGVEVDFDALDSDDKVSLRSQQSVLARAIQRGRLSVDDAGRFVLAAGEKQLVFRAPTGATLMSTDGREGANIRRTFAALAELTGESIPTFAKLPARDVKVCQSIFALFFG